MLHLIKNIILRGVVAASVCAAITCGLSACSDTVSPVPDEYVTLRFNVHAGAQKLASRADSDPKPDDFEGPSGDFETISTLRIIITQPDRNSTDRVLYNKLVATSADGFPADKLEFSVLRYVKYDVYLIANEDILPSPIQRTYPTARAFLDALEPNSELPKTTIDRWTVGAPVAQSVITGNIFSNINGGQPGMPLTQFFEIEAAPVRAAGEDAPTMREEEAMDIHLFMTRVASKASFNISVDPDYKATGVKLTGIRLENIAQSQYVFPRNAVYNIPISPTFDIEWNPDGTVKNKDRYITYFDAPTENTFLNYPISLPQASYVSIEANSKASFGPYYFTETKLSDPNANFRVSVRLSDTNEWIPAKPLKTNILQMTDGLKGIARNTHLIVNINFARPDKPGPDEPGGVSISWNAVVAPYNELTLTPEFGL